MAFVVETVLEHAAAREEMRSFFLGDLAVADAGFDLLLVDLRAHLRVFVEALPDFKGVGAGYELLGEFGGYLSVHDDAAGGGAALARGAEGSPKRAFDGEV